MTFKIQELSQFHISELDKLRNNIDLIYSIINPENTNEDNKDKLRKVVNKVFIIDLYSNWEQFFRKIIGHIYDQYKNILFDKSTINKIFNTTLKKSQKITIDDSGILKIKENLSKTSNLKYSSSQELLSNIGLNIDNFNRVLLENHDLNTCISELKSLGISLSVDDSFNNKKKLPSLDDIVNTIYTIVSLRNEYAHTGKSSISFSYEQMRKYCEFFEKIIFALEKYFFSEILRKIWLYYSDQNNKASIYLKILEILYENSPNKNKEKCSIKIQSSKKIENIQEYDLIIKDNNNYYVANIINIEDINEHKTNYISRGKQYITIETKCSIKREKTIELYLYKHKPNHAFIKLN